MGADTTMGWEGAAGLPWNKNLGLKSRTKTSDLITFPPPLPPSDKRELFLFMSLLLKHFFCHVLVPAKRGKMTSL